MSDLVWSDYFDNDRETSTGHCGRKMTVQELIETLQDCNKPDFKVEIITPDSKTQGVTDVYYDSIDSGVVLIEVT